ncbi:MAG: O-antigen ligase family protein [Anaerolineae bacterium]
MSEEAGLVLVFLQRPPLGLLALVGTIIIPVNGPSNVNATMVLVALLLGLWLFDMMVRQRQIRLAPSAPIRPLLALVIVPVLAFGMGQLPWYTFARPAPMGAQLGGLSIFILSAGVFLLVGHQVRDTRWLGWLTWLFVGLGAVYIAGRFLPPLGGLTRRLFTGQATGSMFWTWLVAVSLGQAIYNRRMDMRLRLALGAIAAATLYVGIVQTQGWKSGWVPPVVVALALVGLRSWRMALLLAVGGLALAPDAVSQLIASDQYSYSTRLDAWLIVVEIVKVNPVLGLGPANYHWYTPLFPIRGYAVQFNSHNQYVDLVAQAGLLGLGAFLWFAWEIGRLGWRLRTRVAEGFEQAYVYAAVAGLAGTMVSAMMGDWVLPFFYNITLGGFRASMLPWLFLGGLVVLEQQLRPADNVEGEGQA